MYRSEIRFLLNFISGRYNTQAKREGWESVRRSSENGRAQDAPTCIRTRQPRGAFKVRGKGGRVLWKPSQDRKVRHVWKEWRPNQGGGVGEKKNNSLYASLENKYNPPSQKGVP